MDTLSVIATLSVLIIVSPFLNNLTRIPVAVIEMFLGAGAAYVGFIELNEPLEIMGKVGFLYLMFLAGMEVDLSRFLEIPKPVLKKIIRYLLTLYGLSLGIFLYFSLPYVYIIALPIVSVGMIMTLIKEHGRGHRWLESAIVIGILGELISITALVVLDGTYRYGLGFEFYMAMGTLLVFLVGTGLFFRLIKILFWWFPEIKLLIMPHVDKKNQDIRFSFTLFFLMVAMMLYLDLEMVLGAFLAGMMINTFFEHKTHLPEKLSAFGFGFLIPIFFIYVGTTLDLNTILSTDLLIHALGIACTMLLMHQISASVAFYSLMGKRDTILLGLSNSMPLTFLIAIATIAHESHALSTTGYYAFVTAAMIEAVTIMIFIKIIHAFFNTELEWDHHKISPSTQSVQKLQ